MRRVDRPMWEPYRCAFTLKDQDPEGFIVGETIKGFDPHAFAAVSWVKQTAAELGWTSPEERAELDALVEERERRVADLEAQLAEADRFAEAAEYTLGRFGQKVHNKPGRKPKEKEAVNG